MPRPFRRATLVAVAVLAFGLLAWPAAASNGSHGFLSLFPPKPPRDAVATTVHIEQHGVDTDPAACGDYGVEWATNLQADVTTYRDAQGRRLQQKVEVTEDNTVKNTATGLTLRDGPIRFTQTTTYDPATNLRQRIYINGVSVLVVRKHHWPLIDAGPLVIDGQTGRILASVGPHPVRELLDGSFDTSLALPAFCDILE